MVRVGELAVRIIKQPHGKPDRIEVSNDVVAFSADWRDMRMMAQVIIGMTEDLMRIKKA